MSAFGGPGNSEMSLNEWGEVDKVKNHMLISW